MRLPTLGCLAVLIVAHATAQQPADLNKDNRDSLARHRIHPIALHGEVIVDDTAIGTARALATQGHLLWVADGKGPPFVHVIDVNSNRLVASYGAKGEGPGDCTVFPHLSGRPGDASNAWGYDEQHRRMTRLPDAARSAQPPTIALPADRSRYDVRWISHDRLLGVTDMDTSRYVVYDATGKLIDRFLGGLLGDNSIPILSRRSASNGFSLCSAADGRHAAVTFIAAGRIEMIDLSTHQRRDASVPFASNGGFTHAADGRWRFDHSTRYYADCAATPRHLYALFVGKQFAATDGRAVAAEYLQMFDWTGKLEAVYLLDQPMSTLTVSGDSVVYAGGTEVTAIYRFRLPKR